jgi:hypothetical protein
MIFNIVLILIARSTGLEYAAICMVYSPDVIALPLYIAKVGGCTCFYI